MSRAQAHTIIFVYDAFFAFLLGTAIMWVACEWGWL